MGATAAVEQIEILKYENAKLRKYDGRLQFKPGGQSQLTKAHVVDDAELLSLLRVPRAIGDFLILDALRASGGTAIAVTDEELIAATREIGAAEGIFCAPEGAACLPALKKLQSGGAVKAGERVVLFNTGSGVKYVESFS